MVNTQKPCKYHHRHKKARAKTLEIDQDAMDLQNSIVLEQKEAKL